MQNLMDFEKVSEEGHNELEEDDESWLNPTPKYAHDEVNGDQKFKVKYNKRTIWLL